MISVNEARYILKSIAIPKNTGKKVLPLEELSGYILAENIQSKVSSPPFNQSAMDGFAVATTASKEDSIYIIGENAAGKTKIKSLNPGQAVRIYTGARVPEGTDFVVPIEFASVENEILRFKHENFKKGDNVRLKGSQFSKGQSILKAGISFNLHSITMLASCGHCNARVYKKPAVAILATGSELVKPGKKIPADKIIETNSLMLKLGLMDAGMLNVKVYHSIDNKVRISKTLKNALKNANVVLFSGGISVGKYDYVRQVLEEMNFKSCFYKIKQKPGKPLYFGRLKDKFVFGLPGNPAAALTCFYEYVLPFLWRLSGNPHYTLETLQKPLKHTYTKKPGLTHFLKARISDESVEILGDQESFKLNSFLDANCLVCLPEMAERIETGTNVECHMLPV